MKSFLSLLHTSLASIYIYCQYRINRTTNVTLQRMYKYFSLHFVKCAPHQDSNRHSGS